ncbi:hypothetical protein SAT01_03710 [Sinomonas atrocyanea]|nr:hypothetical protein [Sinomonas atrocyanea]GEB62923.1 hypothetical protein SAT01_03710 [Sinomonas atrocyanea]
MQDRAARLRESHEAQHELAVHVHPDGRAGDEILEVPGAVHIRNVRGGDEVRGLRVGAEHALRHRRAQTLHGLEMVVQRRPRRRRDVRPAALADHPAGCFGASRLRRAQPQDHGPEGLHHLDAVLAALDEVHDGPHRRHAEPEALAEHPDRAEPAHVRVAVVGQRGVDGPPGGQEALAEVELDGRGRGPGPRGKLTQLHGASFLQGGNIG